MTQNADRTKHQGFSKGMKGGGKQAGELPSDLTIVTNQKNSRFSSGAANGKQLAGERPQVLKTSLPSRK